MAGNLAQLHGPVAAKEEENVTAHHGFKAEDLQAV
jgi:hypothetical protein